jgi:hypothetical protein
MIHRHKFNIETSKPVKIPLSYLPLYEVSMQYRKFGRLDWQASVLGFSCMRFPTLDDVPANIDEQQASCLLFHAIE